MLTHPRSFVYHFGGKTSRPKNVTIGRSAQEICSEKVGLSIEEMDKRMSHYKIFGPSLDKNGDLIKYL